MDEKLVAYQKIIMLLDKVENGTWEDEVDGPEFGRLSEILADDHDPSLFLSVMARMESMDEARLESMNLLRKIKNK